MTLGDKIRKYRSLNGLTQKELGLKIGFSSATADSRIRKYEKDLMAPSNNTCTTLFAKFLYEYNHFIELGADCFTDMQITDKLLTITYYVPVSSFSVITAQINKFLEFRANKDNQTDFSIDSFETSFEESLKTYYNDIEEEISLYSN